MKLEWTSIAEALVDPVDRSALTFREDRSVLVSQSGHEYPISHGQPILLPKAGFESGGWRFPPIRALEARPRPVTMGRGAAQRYQRLIRSMIGGQGQGSEMVRRLRQGRDLSQSGARPRALVVGGASVGDGCAPLVDAPDIDVVSFDIYATNETTFVGDAHRIPLADSSFDAVWIQAVLEHVYSPVLVVDEIARVLRPGGLIYAETPFLQPVHEGAYDYLRFSPSGHRLLFPAFDELAAGPLGGPGAILNLATRGLAGGLSRSRRIAQAAYFLTLPLALLDRLVPSRWRVDYATGAYFLGRLRSTNVSDFDAGTVYRGAQ